MSHSYSPMDPEDRKEFEPELHVDFEPDSQPVTYRPVTLEPRHSFRRFLTEHNPFYLLSAACMLASCLALTNSLSWVSITRTRLFSLILTLNLYEAALLAIALFLITKRGLRRDGRMLLLLQAFFVADFTFLSAEIATGSVRAGLAISAALLVLAAVKMGVVIRVLKPSFTALQFAFVLIQLAVLFTTPVMLRWLDTSRGFGDGEGDPRQFYVVWWVVGMLPALYELFTWLDRGRIVRVSPDAQAAPTTAYLVIPFVSLLVHMGILHWVYRVDYYGAHAAPLLLGLAVVLNRYSPTTLLPRRDLAILRLLVPAAAVLVSANNPFVFDTGIHYPRLTLTTLNLAVAGAFLTYVYCFLLPYARVLLPAGAAVLVAYVCGPTWRQIDQAVESGWSRGATAADRIMPKTLSDWGLIGLVASFALLAIGFWISLRKQPEPIDGNTE